LSTSLIELRKVTKAFPVGNSRFTALNGIDLQISSGKFVAILGKSGSGKSTLINILAGMDSPTSGEVFVNGAHVHRMDQEEVAVWRGKNVGVVFQFFQLLPTLTVLENVLLPMDFCNVIPSNQRKRRALALLDQFGISAQANKLPVNLSGGEQQRAAMARALANDPALILADEPTGNLDSHTADVVLRLFQDLTMAGKTIVMVTHERDIKEMVNQTITLQDGQIIQEALSHATAME
jgi:putative ABC transport system ATP-binding protein